MSVRAVQYFLIGVTALCGCSSGEGSVRSGRDAGSVLSAEVSDIEDISAASDGARGDIEGAVADLLLDTSELGQHPDATVKIEAPDAADVASVADSPTEVEFQSGTRAIELS
jgi:hypothetical protein